MSSLWTLSVFAQRPDFESFKAAIKEAETEEARIRALTQYGDALPNNRHSEVLSIADSVEMMAKNSENTDLIIASSNFLRGASYFKSREYEKAKPYLKHSADLFNELNEETEFQAKNILGLVYIRLREIDSAIYLYNDMLEDLSAENVKKRISAHGNLGSAYRQSGNYALAIQHLETVYELDSANAFTRINTSMNIAHMYNDMEMHERAISTLKQVNINDAPPIPPKVVYYNNLANSFRKNEQLDSAYMYFRKGLLVARAINYAQGEFTALSNLVEFHLEKPPYDSVPELLAEMETKAHMRPMDAAFRINFLRGQYFLKTDKYDQSIEAFKQAELESNKPHLRGLKSGIYHALIDAYTANDNLLKAKEYINKLDQERESPANSKRERFLADAKANFLLANTKKELNQKTQQVVFFNNQRMLFGVSAVILCFIAVILFRSNRKSKKSLKTQHQVKADLQKEIEKQRTQIIELKSKAVIETQEIVSIKSDGHYLEFSLKSKERPEVDRNQLKNILGVLPDYFVQIHRSYIINLKEVRVKFADKIQMKNGQELPVSRSYKSKLNDAMNNFKG